MGGWGNCVKTGNPTEKEEAPGTAGRSCSDWHRRTKRINFDETYRHWSTKKSTAFALPNIACISRSRYYKNRQNNVSNNNIALYKDLEALIRTVCRRKIINNDLQEIKFLLLLSSTVFSLEIYFYVFMKFRFYFILQYASDDAKVIKSLHNNNKQQSFKIIAILNNKWRAWEFDKRLWYKISCIIFLFISMIITGNLVLLLINCRQRRSKTYWYILKIKKKTLLTFKIEKKIYFFHRS